MRSRALSCSAVCSIDPRHGGELRFAEQRAGLRPGDVMAPEPRPDLGHVRPALPRARLDRTEVAHRRPRGRDLRSDARQGAQQRRMVGPTALLQESAVLNERERSAGLQAVGGAAPADIRINPVKGRRREHGRERAAGRQLVLESRVDERDLTGMCGPAPRQRQQVGAGLDGGDVQAARHQALQSAGRCRSRPPGRDRRAAGRRPRRPGRRARPGRSAARGRSRPRPGQRPGRGVVPPLPSSSSQRKRRAGH